MRENISINDSVIKYKGSEEKCLFWIFFYENRYLEFPQTVIQKGICLPKEQSADFLKNSEWQFCD